jgi:putative PIN family toxin of toxin-antitoxin system
MRVILDTNCFLVCISRKSEFRPVFDHLLNDRFTLIMSDDLLLEYEEILSKNASPDVAHNIRIFLMNNRNIHWQKIFYRWLLLYADPDDDKLADLAIAANADYLVTDDKHFNELKKVSFPKVNVISLVDFQSLLSKAL